MLQTSSLRIPISRPTIREQENVQRLADLDEFIDFTELLSLNRPASSAIGGMRFGVDPETNAVVAP